jgi:hypothetical protein
MVMMKVILSTSLLYNIFKHQCYWYSSVLFSMIREEFAGQADDEAHADRAGRFKSCLITKDQAARVGCVRGEYRKAWTAYEEKGSGDREVNFADSLFCFILFPDYSNRCEQK